MKWFDNTGNFLNPSCTIKGKTQGIILLFKGFLSLFLIVFTSYQPARAAYQVAHLPKVCQSFKWNYYLFHQCQLVTHCLSRCVKTKPIAFFAWRWAQPCSRSVQCQTFVVACRQGCHRQIAHAGTVLTVGGWPWAVGQGGGFLTPPFP